MMKTIVKKHPLKNIILEFDESKEPLPIETEALRLYEEAHDVTYALKQVMEVLQKDLARAEGEMEDLYMRGLLLVQELEIIEDSLGIATEEIEVYGDMSIEVTELFIAIENHNQEMQAIYTLIHDLALRHNEHINLVMQEGHHDYYPIHEKYFSLFDEVYPRYEEVSVNIVTLDEDENLFKEVYGEIDKLFSDNLDRGSAVQDRYEHLYEFTNDLYSRAQRASVTLQRFLKDNGMQG